LEESAMEPPKTIRPEKLGDYLEVMTKAVFQSGMSWRVVEAKWDGFREVFAGFDPVTVASFSPDDVDRMAQDTRIIRNRRKIEGTIRNAATLLALEKEFGGFDKYLRTQPEFLPLVKDMRKRFKFVGGFGAYYFLYVVGRPVPPHEEAEELLRAM
jgi:3-methyladenine DNA glycosylase Tag